MLQYIHRNNPEFDQMWETFTDTKSNTSWRYLRKRIEFYKLISNQRLLDDLSFLIIRENKPIAICILFHENIEGNPTFTDFGSYLPAPIICKSINLKDRKKVQNMCFKKIDELATERNIKKVMFRADALTEIQPYNFLLNYNYLDTSTNTCLLNLRNPLTDLWSKIRKSYKSLINNGKKKFEVVIIDHMNLDHKIFNLHKELHCKTAGRMTRSDETWDLQFELIKNDNAILIGLKDSDNFVGFSYFAHSHLKAFYGNSSDDPDYNSNIPLEHTIIWAAVEYYSNRKYEILELGYQHFGQQVFDHPTEKDIKISFFKRGFSDWIYRVPCGVRYYDKEYLQEDLQNNVNLLIKQY
jgi:hypothetical protein